MSSVDLLEPIWTQLGPKVVVSTWLKLDLCWPSISLPCCLLPSLARTRARKDKNKLQKSLPNIHLGLQTPNLDPSSSSSDFLDVPLPSPALSPPEHKENLTKNMSRPRLNILLPGPGGMRRSLFNIYAPPREHHLLYSKWGSPSPQGRLPRCCSPGAPQGLPGGSIRASYWTLPISAVLKRHCRGGAEPLWRLCNRFP